MVKAKLSFVMGAILGVSLACLLVSGEMQRYDQYKLLTVATTSPEQVARLRSLERNGTFQLDFWSESHIFSNTDILVPPQHYAHVVSLLRGWGINVTTSQDNIQRLIDQEYGAVNPDIETAPSEIVPDGQRAPLFRSVLPAPTVSPVSPTPPAAIGRYLKYNEILSWLSELQTSYPRLVRLQDIGTTHENRTIKMIKIGKPLRCRYFRFWWMFRHHPFLVLPKPVIFIEAGIHGREWIAPAVSLYIINHLLTNYNKDRTVRSLLKRYDWYILPVANPDGYVYSHTTDRLWRKNRSVIANSRCIGTDLNRNFDVNWRGPNSGHHPCSSDFAGASAFSEKESQSIRDVIKCVYTRLYFDLHAYSQFILLPWTYTDQKPYDYVDLRDVAMMGRDALYAVHNTSYTVGTSGDILYLADGTSRDWAKLRLGVKWAFGFELRPTEGSYGFLLPQDQIIPSGEETWAAIKAMVIDSESAWRRRYP